MTSEDEHLVRQTIADLISAQRKLAQSVSFLQVLVGDEPSDYRDRFYGRSNDRERQEDPGPYRGNTRPDRRSEEA